MQSNETDAEPMYFGNDDQQTRVAETLEKAIDFKKSKLQLVIGPPATGKFSVAQLLNEGLQQGRKFDCLADPDQIAEDDIPSEVPKALKDLVRAMDFENGVYIQHHIYKAYEPAANGKPFFVVVADGETPLTDPNALEMLQRAAELVKDPKKDFELLWVADVPVRLQAIPIFKPSTSALKELERHEAELAKFIRAHDKSVAAHTLKYDVPTIRDALWDAIASDGQKFIGAFAHTTHKATEPANRAEWDAACKAALEQDRDAYTKAFRTLAARAKPDRSRAA